MNGEQRHGRLTRKRFLTSPCSRLQCVQHFVCSTLKARKVRATMGMGDSFPTHTVNALCPSLLQGASPSKKDWKPQCSSRYGFLFFSPQSRLPKVPRTRQVRWGLPPDRRYESARSFRCRFRFRTDRYAGRSIPENPASVSSDATRS